MGWNDHCSNPEDACYQCGALINWEDAYEDAGENTICGACFDRMIDASERAHEGDR